MADWAKNMKHKIDKKIKILLLVAIIIAASSIVYIYRDRLFPPAEYWDQGNQHYPVGTYFEYFNFYVHSEDGANYDITFYDPNRNQVFSKWGTLGGFYDIYVPVRTTITMVGTYTLDYHLWWGSWDVTRYGVPLYSDPPSPEILTFESTKYSVEEDESFILSWTTDWVTNTTLYSNGNYFDDFPAYHATVPMTISQTTTFGLVAHQILDDGTIRDIGDELTVTYIEPPPPPPPEPDILSFTSTKSIVTGNETFNLIWSTINATNCDLYANDTYLGNYEPNYETDPLLIKHMTVFKLVANGESGSTSDERTLTVDYLPPGPPQPPDDDDDGDEMETLTSGDNHNLILIVFVLIIIVALILLDRFIKKKWPFKKKNVDDDKGYLKINLGKREGENEH